MKRVILSPFCIFNCYKRDRLVNMNKTQVKNLKEKEQLEKFLKTEIGARWSFENNIINIQKSEAPDFVLFTNSDDKIALEVTEFIVDNKNLRFSQVVRRIGNQVCKEAEKDYNLKISILVDKYEPRNFSPSWKEHLDYAYNPGFSEIPQKDIFKRELQKVLKNNLEKLRKGFLVQEWIEVDREYFKISIEAYMNPWTKKYECSVNNIGKAEENPINELQKCIDNKNKKIDTYRTKANKCYLLIYIPGTGYANYYHFDKEFFYYKFNSKFDQIFLYEENTNKTIVLKQ